MAIIEKRITSGGEVKFRAKVRIKGHRALSETFTRRTDAKQWAKRMEAAILEGRYLPQQSESRKHTVFELIKRYIDEVLPLKPKMIYEQTHQFEWFQKEIGPLILADVTPAVLVQCRTKLISEKTARGKIRMPTTANRYMAALSHVFTVATNEWGWIDNNPFPKVKKFKEPRGRTRFLSEEELEKLLAACKTSRCSYLLLIVTLAVSTGMRYSEILNLSWEDVNLRDGYLILSETKNGTQRRVPLHGPALALFKNHNRLRRIDTSLVFPGTDPKKAKDVHTAFDHVREKVKLKDFRFHDLRHSAASYLAMNGATTRDIAEILGHKTLQMVKRYAHLTDSHCSKVVAKMNEEMISRFMP